MPPGDGEQRRQQDDEREVFGQQRMHQTGPRRLRAKTTAKGQQKCQRPGSHQLAEMVVPEHGSHQRHERDRQQDAGEGHAPQQRQLAAIDIAAASRRATAPGQAPAPWAGQGRRSKSWGHGISLSWRSWFLMFSVSGRCGSPGCARRVCRAVSRRRDVEHLAQVGQVALVIAHGLAGGVRNLATGWSLQPSS